MKNSLLSAILRRERAFKIIHYNDAQEKNKGISFYKNLIQFICSPSLLSSPLGHFKYKSE